jgi:hypothetical protein
LQRLHARDLVATRHAHRLIKGFAVFDSALTIAP